MAELPTLLRLACRPAYQQHVLECLLILQAKQLNQKPCAAGGNCHAAAAVRAHASPLCPLTAAASTTAAAAPLASKRFFRVRQEAPQLASLNVAEVLQGQDILCQHQSRLQPARQLLQLEQSKKIPLLRRSSQDPRQGGAYKEACVCLRSWPAQGARLLGSNKRLWPGHRREDRCLSRT